MPLGSDNAWPLVLAGPAATMELLQAQFRASERAPPAYVRAQQEAQVARLFAHAHTHSVFWRTRLAAAGYGTDAHCFTRLPILTRGDLQEAGASAYALPVPRGHGKVHRTRTSGSTGQPLEVLKTDLTILFLNAMTLRDSLWRRRDLRGTLAVIRVGAQQRSRATWGSAYIGYACGPAVSFDAREDTDAQLDWLLAQQPQILMTHASNLRALAVRSIERGIRLTGLREARSYSERVAPDLRERVRDAWHVPLTDLYSTTEAGSVALQCPLSERLHVLSEDVLVEIVDDAGRPCAEGETGRVVVTSLHNFAMPFVRYDLGDYATVGPACPCGRTLPTLTHIRGRTRNMLRLPDGRSAWPGFPVDTLVALDAIRELKMIQHTLTEIEIELVLARPLTPPEQTRLIEAVRTRLRHPFEIRLSPVARIARGAGHKWEDFECRVN